MRLPPEGWEALRLVLPRATPVLAEDLPLVTRVVPDLESARLTAERLRATGAAVVVLEDPPSGAASPFCPAHPVRLGAGTCRRCGAAICGACVLEAAGDVLCPSCADVLRERRRWTRTRQLFVGLLFTVFLYQVAAMLLTDRARVSPTGPVEVGLFQFAPPQGIHAPIVDALNAPGGAEGAGSGWAELARWFDDEHRRYAGGDGRYLRLTVRGPWGVQVEPPRLAGPDDGMWAVMTGSWRYARYFRNLALDHGVDPERYAVRLYVLYGDPDEAGDLAAHSRGSERGRLAISWISLGEQNPAYALETVAHELAHTLGALDSYREDNYLARHPEGFVEPFADPLYPQRYAELMAVDIPVGPDEEAEVRSLDQVRIGHATAAQMSWIGEEQARWFYTPPADGPEDRLPPADRSTSTSEAEGPDPAPAEEPPG